MLSHYLCIGLGVYAACAVLNRHMFKGTTLVEIARGAVLGFLLWPAALVLLWFLNLNTYRKNEE